MGDAVSCPQAPVVTTW